MVWAYLLALISGVSVNPSALAASANLFQSLSEKEIMMVQAYLLCAISGG